MELNSDEREELEALRLYKAAHEGKAINRAFLKLEQLLESVGYDPLMNVRSFRVMAECLICLKEEMEGSLWNRE